MKKSKTKNSEKSNDIQKAEKLESLKNHLKDIIIYMRDTKSAGTACRFIVPCCFLDYLTKLYFGKSTASKHYIEFVEKILKKVNVNYKDFKYKNGETDLPNQIYYVMRCGLVHSFSLTPEKKYKNKNSGRTQSIVLADETDVNLNHLAPFSNDKIKDACIFKLEVFINDLEKVLDKLFKIAEHDLKIQENILNWSKECPFIVDLN